MPISSVRPSRNESAESAAYSATQTRWSSHSDSASSSRVTLCSLRSFDDIGGSAARINSSCPCINSTRVTVSDGTRVNQHPDIVLSPAGGVGRAVHRRERTARRKLIRQKRQVFGTSVRHAACAAPRAVLAVSLGVVFQALGRCLLPGAHRASNGELSGGATTVVAVALAPIARPTDEEDA